MGKNRSFFGDGAVSRRRFLLATSGSIALGGVFFFTPWGCSPDAEYANTPLQNRLIRVNIASSVTSVSLTGPQVLFATSLKPQWQSAALNGTLVYASNTWSINGVSLGSGELVIHPRTQGDLSVNSVKYRGQFKLVPTSGNQFDVVNQVDIEDYLKGVTPCELYDNFHPTTYKAQTIVARTYAFYEMKTRAAGNHFDVWSTVRSQVYGGYSAETPKSRDAADQTAGMVLAFGPAGNEKIFKAYFSSCCGGISQSASDAFGDPPSQPLSETNPGPLCSSSPRFNWNVSMSRSELTRRIQAWGQRVNRSEKAMSLVQNIQIARRNRLGRPIAYYVDDRALRYTLRAEDFRVACNTDANDSKLFSSFLESIDISGERFTFMGHGAGHGVGMCQWCAEARALKGMSYETIAKAPYPGAILTQAY